MKSFGCNGKNLYFEDTLDSDGELEVKVETYVVACAWINEEGAIDLIKHLKVVFNIEGEY